MARSNVSLPRRKVKDGPKKKGKKTKTTGKKKPTSSTIVGRKRNGSACLLVFLVVFSYLIAIVLGAFVIASCVSTSANVNHIYLAELSRSETYDVSLRIGYFGGCVSVTETAAEEALSSPNDNSSNQTSTHCVSSMRGRDLDDLSEEFWESLDTSPTTQSTVQSFLNAALPQAKYLQENVFFWHPPLLHFILFIITGIMLLVARTGTSKKRTYKAMIVTTIILSAFSLALALVTVLGSLQGLNALLNISASRDQWNLGNGLFISRGDTMHGIQGALVGVAALFYVLMGALFVQRTPEGGVGYIIQAIQTVGAPLKRRIGRRG
ncbi:hypothetical protein BDW59DRAFT_168535 [Aspergillus cavernicola]|uniref:Integral membrane protein n=1 Tax=Aspergillus cavernicola TaxID=176166 RepID=A0ABR4J2A7_9EURO